MTKDKVKLTDILFQFLKKETVLCIAAVLAFISAFLVPPDLTYLKYIDFSVLSILFCLMAIMAGLQELGVFEDIGLSLLNKTANLKQLELVLVFLCFFSSMFITNDVALITFVPFALFTLKMAKREEEILFVVILQTLAANLGSMLTPLGNPQNLYLYNLMNISVKEFVMFMLPFTTVSGLIILIRILFRKDKMGNFELKLSKDKHSYVGKQRIKLISYLIMFILSLLVVTRVLPYVTVLLIVIVTMWIMDRNILKKVDYCLLLTFISFFIFIGNMERIPAIHHILGGIVQGNELFSGIVLSQFISNVPAALLISGFTDKYKTVLLGVDLGGLGTLIASMASLISYKIYVNAYNEKRQKYLIKFTLYNIVFLILLILFYQITLTFLK